MRCDGSRRLHSAGRASSRFWVRPESARRLWHARSWSSETLATRLGRWRDEGRHLAFLVGGSHGLSPELARGAQHRWSLGAITLPHELARVVVYEQLYRAWTIIRGEPYHK